MSTAAAGPASADTGTLDLDELRFHWGSAYDIGADSERYTARRRDGQGTLLAGSGPEDLQLQIKADYQAMPVARDAPGNGESRQQAMSGADKRALDAPRLAWGDAYEIYAAGGQWQAWRDEAAGEDILTRSTATELNLAIRADWARKGMP